MCLPGVIFKNPEKTKVTKTCKYVEDQVLCCLPGVKDKVSNKRAPFSSLLKPGNDFLVVIAQALPPVPCYTLGILYTHMLKRPRDQRVLLSILYDLVTANLPYSLHLFVFLQRSCYKHDMTYTHITYTHG
jgi:hypothetical protein